MEEPDSEKSGETPAAGGDGPTRGKKGKEGARVAKASRNLMLYVSLVLAMTGIATAGLALVQIHAAEEQVAQAKAKVAEIGNRLAVTTEAFAKYQAVARQDKAALDEALKLSEAHERLIAHEVARTQARLKISPDIEKVLQSDTVPPGASPVKAPGAAKENSPSPSAQHVGPKRAPGSPVNDQQKIERQIHGIQEAIQKFNGN